MVVVVVVVVVGIRFRKLRLASTRISSLLLSSPLRPAPLPDGWSPRHMGIECQYHRSPHRIINCGLFFHALAH